MLAAHCCLSGSSLAPLVFQAAFVDKDPLALNVLNVTSAELVDQVCILLRNDERARNGITAANGVLCFGGSLVGVEGYRKMLLDKAFSYPLTYGT